MVKNRQKIKLDPDEMPKWLSTLWDLSKYDGIIAGINDDDCAIIQISKNNKLVITTDYLNYSPIGKELGICSYYDIGRLIVGANISDLCGTGAIPKAFLLGIMLNKGSSSNDYKEIIRGVKFELDKINIPLIGGDSKLGKEDIFYGVAIGSSTNKQKLFTKKEALPGDNIWISGRIGSVSAAVYGLSNAKMDVEWENWARKQILEPKLPVEESKRIAKLKIGNGGTDISDGLGADVINLAKLSGVGVIINPKLIPLDSEVHLLANKINIPAWYFAFLIGGDFQFLVTSHNANDCTMESIGMTKIGRITKNKKYLLEFASRSFCPMPITGHRDINKPNFANEVFTILDLIKENYKNAL